MKMLVKYYFISAVISCLVVSDTYANALDVTKTIESDKRVVIIKADDFRGPNHKWQHFVQLAQDKDIKVSIGIIANNFPLYDKSVVKWVREQQKSGRVEFWNHGWDHNRWKDKGGKKISEFANSGYEHQKINFDKSQKKLVRI